ncbi:LysR family transcriptional regulator [Herbaspirillum sp. WKF16]|jgi:DNA-binding transcriptional LysR family regulator|uniref:LysR family transcriptional regulator n=1 Tax=Herbaspirillum sp. WKF16 TaxID=3028312 RepID=UPI0023A9E36A|nr:LysR family transcriptional regulator [Herbaspirillum sp. WKF16]WDZ95001.1 LysR family transcriptional regulator [Herbaspirillum sp. WKF16]
MDRFSELKAFAVVAGAGGFSAAARTLGIAPSSVVRLIDALEKRIGARLLNRSTRTVTLTDSGRLYYDSVLTILEQTEEAESSASQEGIPQGRLKVSAPVTFSTRYIAPALFELQSLYPKLSVYLDLTDGISNLAEDSIDVAIRIGAPGTQSNLISRRLAGQRRVICASPDYFSAVGMPRTPAELQRHDCLVFAYGDGRQQWRFCLNADAGGAVDIVDVKGSLCVNNSEMLRQACLAGHGIAMLPDWLVMDDVRGGRLVWALQEYEANPGPMDVGIYAMYPPSREGAPKVQAFVDMLEKHLAGTLPTRQ